MKYIITGATSVGNYRSHNEDAVLLGESVIVSGGKQIEIYPPFMCAVCDGVGGENAGEIASRLTAELLSTCSYQNAAELKSRIFEIHDKLIEFGELKPDAVNMQTTLCLIAFDKNDIPCCINVGDSRAYIISNGEIKQLTTDQSLAQYLTETGRAEKFGIDLKGYKNVIISSVGNPKQYPIVDMFVGRKALEPYERLLICSDGVSDYLSEQEILDKSNGGGKEVLNELLESALKNGSRDNLSAVMIETVGA